MKHLQMLLILWLFTAKVDAQTTPNNMVSQKNYTILVLMNATPQWLSHTRSERADFFEKRIMPIFQKVSKTVKVQLFDSEYFHAQVSDFIIITTSDLEQYKLMIELLRDSKIYGEPYFQIKDIIVGQENAFEDFNILLKNEH
ncbi:hypothetical protein Emtol_2170 [Emticicia oligotrophica DSM 17448]|uniref:DUF4174 domain-containing protein n=1 Tax=Emticicia oligotrophica (strain DSM 17448 / CIP 109782 / MTCC 6937 / GPTSA100-15) TaxID=929562 RepID=A0ABM5N1H4_EMTOG|nr:MULTISPECIES: darcynin family protein [Emticicia]AFK03308.1 hypothetical protein Emtol_2170 [Emticicia oligotrophica DSM 17448]